MVKGRGYLAERNEGRVEFAVGHVEIRRRANSEPKDKILALAFR